MPLKPSLMGDIQKAFEELWSDLTQLPKEAKGIKLANKLSDAFLDSVTNIICPLAIVGTLPPSPIPPPYVAMEPAKVTFSTPGFPMMSSFSDGWDYKKLAPITAKSDAEFFAKGFWSMIAGGIVELKIHSGAPALIVPPDTVLSALIMPVFLSVYTTLGFIGAPKAKSTALASGIMPHLIAFILMITVVGPIVKGPPAPLPIIAGIGTGVLV